MLTAHDVEEYIKKYGYWSVHPDHPLEDWRYEIANDDTRQGYWQWVKGRLEEKSHG